MVKMIIQRQYDPVILFSFSKRECEFLAMQVSSFSRLMVALQDSNILWLKEVNVLVDFDCPACVVDGQDGLEWG